MTTHGIRAVKYSRGLRCQINYRARVFMETLLFFVLLLFFFFHRKTSLIYTHPVYHCFFNIFFSSTHRPSDRSGRRQSLFALRHAAFGPKL